MSFLTTRVERMNACDNISELSRELVLLAISFTTAELRVFCTGLCQRGGSLRPNR
jgi:hypothetical protein